MEILDSYEFKRPSRSRYAPVVDALVNGVGGKKVFAVKLKRGEDFPQASSISSVQGAISTQVREAGRRAKTFAESDDVLVVSLWPEGEGPRVRRRSSRGRAVVNA
jgi:hypothetical protein